NRAIVEGG
ncbi:hypothetical protein ANME2D_02902, partial [Candidatus Methanoperedens nitroreducens]